MVTLLPRVTPQTADSILDKFLSRGVGKWLGFNSNNLPDQVLFAATGGSRASPIQLQKLRNEIEGVAIESGFRSKSGKCNSSNFDSTLSARLAVNPILNSGESLRDDTWAFFGVVVAPDIVLWRFGHSRERYIGGVRNTFQRLWMRGCTLDRGANCLDDRWLLLDELTEDALVQITERPSIGADPILAREIAEAWVRAAKRYGKSRMEPIMRYAVLRIRIQNEFRSISTLPRVELARTFDRFFDKAEEAVRTSNSM